MLRLVLALSLSILACSSQDAKPVIDQVVPSQIAPNIATSIEIRGEHLYSMALLDLDGKQPVRESSDFQVHIGQQEVARADVRRTSSEQVVVQLPPLSEGVYDVVLTLPDSSSATLPRGLQVGTPPMVDAGSAMVDAGSALVCPVGYAVSPAGGCYRIVANPLTWQQAEADCENDAVGAHLIVVDDVDEDAMLPDSHWIGYSENVTAGVFLWVTNSSGAYTGFDLGEPVAGGNGLCVVTRPNGWHDDNCGELKAYVCEFDGIPADPATF
jgi:hypothetical protein